MTIESKLLCESVYTPAELIPIVGKAAASLCQFIHYRTRNSKIESEGERWIVLSAEAIAEKLRCSVRTVQRAIACLRQHDLIHTRRIFAHRYNQTLGYRPNYEALEQILTQEAKLKPSMDNLDPPKCQTQFRQNVSPETAILAESINKNLNTSNKEQQQIGGESKVQFSNPPIHPVSVSPEINRERMIEKPKADCKGQEDLDPEIEQEIVKEIGHQLSKSFRELIANSPMEAIQNALVILRQGKDIKNKAGYFRAALQKRFKPSADKIQSENNRLDPDFHDWFDLMKQLGLAMASELQDGTLWIHCSPGNPPTLYEELRPMFSMSYLKRKLGLI